MCNVIKDYYLYARNKFTYFGSTTIRCRMRARIRSTVGASDDLVHSSSTTSSSSALSLLFTLRQGLRRRNL